MAGHGRVSSGAASDTPLDVCYTRRREGIAGRPGQDAACIFAWAT